VLLKILKISFFLMSFIKLGIFILKNYLQTCCKYLLKNSNTTNKKNNIYLRNISYKLKHLKFSAIYI
jgi:hypothetical protein